MVKNPFGADDTDANGETVGGLWPEKSGRQLEHLVIGFTNPLSAALSPCYLVYNVEKYFEMFL